MNVAFILSMSNRGSWNGGWSGERNIYAVVRSYGSRRFYEEEIRPLVAKGSFYYSWGDGWGASVAVKAVDAAEAKSLRKRSKGFCGYEWMIQSILVRGKILADHQIPENEGKIPSGEVGPFARKWI